MCELPQCFFVLSSHVTRLGRDPSDDVHRTDVRPPPRRRPRGGHVPQDDQEGRRGPQDHVLGTVALLRFPCLEQW